MKLPLRRCFKKRFYNFTPLPPFFLLPGYSMRLSPQNFVMAEPLPSNGDLLCKHTVENGKTYLLSGTDKLRLSLLVS